MADTEHETLEQRRQNAILDRELLQRITLGLDMEAFIKSNAGRHLIERCEQERAMALDELAAVDAENPRKIRKLQFNVAVIDCLQQWMADAIADGKNAEEQAEREG